MLFGKAGVLTFDCFSETFLRNCPIKSKEPVVKYFSAEVANLQFLEEKNLDFREDFNTSFFEIFKFFHLMQHFHFQKLSNRHLQL